MAAARAATRPTHCRAWRNGAPEATLESKCLVEAVAEVAAAPALVWCGWRRCARRRSAPWMKSKRNHRQGAHGGAQPNLKTMSLPSKPRARLWPSKPCHRRATREPRESPWPSTTAQGARCQSLKSLHCQRVYNNHHAFHHPVQRSGCEPMSGTRMAIKTPNNTAVAILRAFEAPSACACVDRHGEKRAAHKAAVSERERGI